MSSDRAARMVVGGPFAIWPEGPDEEGHDIQWEEGRQEVHQARWNHPLPVRRSRRQQAQVVASIPSPALDGPPPSPANPAPAGFGGLGPEAGQGTPPQQGPQDKAKVIVQMGAELDRALMAFSQIGPEGSNEFGQARNLLKAGLAKVISANAGGQGQGAPATSPTAAGAQFPSTPGAPRT